MLKTVAMGHKFCQTCLPIVYKLFSTKQYKSFLDLKVNVHYKVQISM